MKTVFTSLLMLMMGLGQAMPAFTDSTENGKTNHSSTPASTMTMQQLQAENQQLKIRLMALENMLEEEKGRSQYKMVMTSIFTQLHQANQNTEIDNLRAIANFNKIMGTALLKLQSQAYTVR